MDTNNYREYAKECLRWAAEAKTEEERQAFLVMAEQWVEAALRAESVLAPTEPGRSRSPIALLH